MLGSTSNMGMIGCNATEEKFLLLVLAGDFGVGIVEGRPLFGLSFIG